jgi:hypothetical protein
VRGLGVTAKDVDPNHVSAKHGEFAPRIMAPHIAKLPRIVVDA